MSYDRSRLDERAGREGWIGYAPEDHAAYRRGLAQGDDITADKLVRVAMFMIAEHVFLRWRAGYQDALRAALWFA
jgi:hypothetical protein